MNQILYREQQTNNIPEYDMFENRKKTKSISMLVFVLPLAVSILLFSLSVYAQNKSQDDSILFTNDTNDMQDLFVYGAMEEENKTNNFDNNNTVFVESKDNKNNVETFEYKADSGESYFIIATLNIPRLKIEYPILSTTSKELLNISLNKYWGANPNEVGNMVVVGHNYKNGKMFGKLSTIKIGDIIEITDMQDRKLNYAVYATDIIDPYDNSCTSQLTNGKKEITLITCYNSGKQRFVAKAKEI